ncbi:hypothetical protein [Streptomyces cinereospinus]|uniref:Secreted protein n=1 Tax=Streptomyces cinereospinus TaxID=285561 RepID=A0ABV5N3S5_9ACTN
MLANRSATHARPGSASGVPGRALAGHAVLAVLTAVAGLIAYLTRDGNRVAQPSAPSATGSATATASAAPSPSASEPVGKGSVAEPPKTTDPVVFGKAFAKALWSYDARTLSQPQQLAGLKAWMTSEKKYADWSSVSAQLPTKDLWKQLRTNGQYATARISEGHIPTAFTAALNDNPGAITTAYVYAVTVTGTQSIAWDGGGAGAESRSITLAVQCRPHERCALSGMAPSVSP